MEVKPEMNGVGKEDQLKHRINAVANESKVGEDCNGVSSKIEPEVTPKINGVRKEAGTSEDNAQDESVHRESKKTE